MAEKPAMSAQTPVAVTTFISPELEGVRWLRRVPIGAPLYLAASAPEQAVSPSEALYGFAGWLTCRSERSVFSGFDDAAPAAQLVAAYCKANGFADPREGWDKNIQTPAPIALASPARQPEQQQEQHMKVTDEMVSRFLCWPLPKTFSPDCCIAFDRESASRLPTWPMGTNLLNADEARQMLEHVLAARQEQNAPTKEANIVQSCGMAGGYAAMGVPAPMMSAPAEPPASTTQQETLTCGHHVSLWIKSVESAYAFCDLCECRKQRADAELMETELRRELSALRAKEGEHLRGVLKGHWLAGIQCEHDDNAPTGGRDKASCSCSLVDLGWHPTVQAAAESWIEHVVAAARCA
jgi:hypothetical protein